MLPGEASSSREPALRRTAATALARIHDPGSASALRKLLADEDLEVAAWAGYGLSALCAGREAETVRALAARAASWAGRIPRPPAADRAHADLPVTLADALSRCGTDEAEGVLRGWLDVPELGPAAARALGRLSTRRHALSDATVVALLDAAAKVPPLEGAFDAFAHLGVPSPAMRQRLVDSASRAVGASGVDRTSAIRALVAAPLEGASLLGRILRDETFRETDRTVAAVTLARLEPPSDEVAKALVALVTRTPDDRLAAHQATVRALLAGLAAPGEARAALARLAALPRVEDPVLLRRRVALRCGAARVLAGGAPESRALQSCDYGAHGRSWALSVLAVLDGEAIEGARAGTFRRLATGSDPVARRVALSMLERHTELDAVEDLLARGLSAKEPGVVTEAARALTTQPSRALGKEDAGGAREPSAAIVTALAAALDRDRPPDEIGPRAALLSAAGALGILSLKPRVERACKSPSAVLREAAERALRALGSTKTVCGVQKMPAPKAVPGEDAPLTLTFVTDAGRLGLTLEPGLAPLSVMQIADLARSGFYDGVAVHRVIPGSLVQLGDPGGDGYGGSGRPPLPGEVSPLEFGPFTVGLALAGPDTGGSQIFVTLSEEPGLFGDYPVIGHADPEWALLEEGDVVKRVEIGR